jgi:hypothetical protein
VLESITDWILSLSAGWALAVVFLGPALESSAFVGFVFPGEVAVLLGGSSPIKDTCRSRR